MRSVDLHVGAQQKLKSGSLSKSSALADYYIVRHMSDI